MMDATDWAWMLGVIVFPVVLTLWNIRHFRKGSMFFLAFTFLADSRFAKLLVTVLYLIWSIGAHLRYKNLRTGNVPGKRKKPTLKAPVREESPLPECPRAP